MLAAKEVKFPLIVLTLIKVVEAEGKIPVPKSAGNIGDSRLGRGGGWSQASPVHILGGGGGVSVKFSRQEWQINFIHSDDTEKVAASCVKDSHATSRLSRKESHDQ